VLFTRAIVVPVGIVVLVALFGAGAGVATGLPLLVAVAFIAAVAMTVLDGTRRIRPPVLELMPERLDPRRWAWRPVGGIAAMPFTRNSLASLWIIAFGLFALSGGATMAAPVLLLVVAGLAALGARWTVGARVRHVRAPAFDRRALAASATRDPMRMDSDKGHTKDNS
jgi:hypothetical protein